MKRDQVLFVAQFAYACNCVWDDEQNDVPMKRRHRFNMLLLGQGGSGKTAVIQEIVLPAMDFLFPPDPTDGGNPVLIVCAKWSQAENISTDTHTAVSCHRAAHMGIGSHSISRSSMMRSIASSREQPWNKSSERALAWSDLLARILSEKALACSDHLARISFG